MGNGTITTHNGQSNFIRTVSIWRFFPFFFLPNQNVNPTLEIKACAVISANWKKKLRPGACKLNSVSGARAVFVSLSANGKRSNGDSATCKFESFSRWKLMSCSEMPCSICHNVVVDDDERSRQTPLLRPEIKRAQRRNHRKTAEIKIKAGEAPEREKKEATNSQQ